MVYADAAYYEEEYLLGRAATIPIREFPFWERKARERMNWRKLEVNPVPDYLANCVCELAELLYSQSQATSSGAGSPAKASESVGAYSVSYRDNTLKSDEFSTAVRDIIGNWLAGTSLHNQFIYRGGV